MALLAMSRLAAMRRLPLAMSPAWRGLAQEPAKAADAAAEAAGKPANSSAEPDSGTLQESRAEPNVEAATEGGAEPNVEAATEGGAEPNVEAVPEGGAEPGAGGVQEGVAQPDVKAAPESDAKSDHRTARPRRSAGVSQYMRHPSRKPYFAPAPARDKPSMQFIGKDYPTTPDQFLDAIKTLTLDGDYVAAKKLYDDMIALGHAPPPKVYGPLMGMAAHRCKPQDAHQIVKQAKEFGFFLGPQDYYRLLKLYAMVYDPAAALMLYEQAKAQSHFIDSTFLGLLLEAISSCPLSARKARNIMVEFEANGHTPAKRTAYFAMKCAWKSKDVKFGREIFERFEHAGMQYIQLVCTDGDSDDFEQMQEKVKSGQLLEPKGLYLALYHARQGDVAKALEAIKNYEVMTTYSQDRRTHAEIMRFLRRCKDAKDAVLEYVEVLTSRGATLDQDMLHIALSVMIDAGDVPHAKEFAEQVRKFPIPHHAVNTLMNTKYKYFLMRTGNADQGAADISI